MMFRSTLSKCSFLPVKSINMLIKIKQAMNISWNNRLGDLTNNLIAILLVVERKVTDKDYNLFKIFLFQLVQQASFLKIITCWVLRDYDRKRVSIRWHQNSEPMKIMNTKQQNKNRNIASQEIAGMDHSNKCTVSMVKAPLSAAWHWLTAAHARYVTKCH